MNARVSGNGPDRLEHGSRELSVNTCGVPKLAKSHSRRGGSDMAVFGDRSTRNRSKFAATSVVVATAVAACHNILPQPAAPGAPSAGMGSFHRRAGRADASCPDIGSDKIHRFIMGVDTCPVVLSSSDVDAELHDAFAELLLKKNIFPAAVDELAEALVRAGPRLTQRSYVVGEGANIPVSTAAPREANRDLRYVVTWDDGDDRLILLSTDARKSSFIQVISWDGVKKSFNFYDFESTSWRWSGDSSWSRVPGAAGQGCFDCHHNGSVIMKELERPWNNWHSELASIDQGVVPAAVAADPLFQQRRSASGLESTIRGGVRRLYASWVPPAGDVARVPDLLRHLTLNTTVNLLSSLVQSRGMDPLTIPSNFFLADSTLRNTLRLKYAFPPAIEIARGTYDAFVESHHFRLVNTEGKPYEQAGATHFALLVPVPSLEDQAAVQQMTQKNIVSVKFAGSVLMVDLQNPVFSAKRAGLQKYAEQIRAWSYDGTKSDLPAQFAARVTAGASGQLSCADANIISQAQLGEPAAFAAELAKLDRCSAEQQFLFYWGLDDDAWPKVTKAVVEAYLAAAAGRIATPGGASDYLKLSVSRASAFSRTDELPGLQARFGPIHNLHEFSLLLPVTDLPDNPVLRMKIDGTIEPAPL
ncbi:hypothetical protein WMF38_25730 [Sorangium sp. So ce118]